MMPGLVKKEKQFKQKERKHGQYVSVVVVISCRVGGTKTSETSVRH